MTEGEDDILETIRKWVWSGYHDEAAVRRMLPDIVEGDVDASAIQAAIADEFKRKAEAEASWPDVTDCDRLDKAFIQLDSEGICAAQYAGYAMSDGHAEIAEALHVRGAEKYHGFCFFSGQDAEWALAGRGLWITYGDLTDDEAKSIAVGRRVFDVLRASGLSPEWDGAVTHRIGIPAIDWKRRY